jgi:hypothetical protein
MVINKTKNKERSNNNIKKEDSILKILIKQNLFVGIKIQKIIIDNLIS